MGRSRAGTWGRGWRGRPTRLAAAFLLTAALAGSFSIELWADEAPPGSLEDTTAPGVAVDSVGDYLIGATDTGTDVSWHASENGTYSVRTGGGSCTAGAEIASGAYDQAGVERTVVVKPSDLPQGVSTIRVCVSDTAGNVGSAAVRVARDSGLGPTPTTLTFGPEADARVQESARSTNYGTATTLRTDGGTDPDVESYLRFAPTGVSGVVESAKLRLWVTNGSVNGPAVYSSAGGWTENAIAWSNKPARTSPATDDKGSIGSGAWVEYDVKSLLAGSGPHSFALATTSSDGVDFNSREASDASRRPQLVLTISNDGSGDPPPTAPSGLLARAASGTQVDLSWSPAADNGTITGYRIYRDGSLIATPGQVTSYRDGTASDGTTYMYEAQALDERGNASPLSDAAEVTTPRTLTVAAVADARVQESTRSTNYGTATALRTDGGTDPDVESYLSFAPTVSGAVESAKLRLWVTNGSVNGPAVYSSAGGWAENAITWSNKPARTSPATDDKGSIGSGVWVEYDVKSLLAGSGPHSFALATTSSDGVDFNSREASDASRRPQLVLTMASDGEPPSPPENLVAAATGPRAVDLSWSPSSDNVGVTGYRVYRNGSLLATLGAVTGHLDATAQPGTTYSYALEALDGSGNASAPSSAVEVTTPEPAVGEDAIVAAAGDIACSSATGSFNAGEGTATSCRQKATSDLVLERNVAAVLPLGDLQYDSGILDRFNDSYDLSWGRFKSITRPAPGNHEYGTSGAAGYFDYFNGVGNAGGPAGERGKGWYSFDVGGWHLVALNSNCSRVGGCGAGSAQEQWLRADLAAHPSECTLAYWHHARFSSGTTHGDNPGMAPLWQALQDAGADVLLTGHEHNYERFAPQDAGGAANPSSGIREFVVGTGGKGRYQLGTAKPNSEARDASSFGVLFLTLDPDSYSWDFVPAPGSSFTDSGSASCHP